MLHVHVVKKFMHVGFRFKEKSQPVSETILLLRFERYEMKTQNYAFNISTTDACLVGNKSLTDIGRVEEDSLHITFSLAVSLKRIDYTHNETGFLINCVGICMCTHVRAFSVHQRACCSKEFPKNWLLR